MINDPLTPTEHDRLEALRKKGPRRMQDDEIREFQKLLEKHSAAIRFRSGRSGRRAD